MKHVFSEERAVWSGLAMNALLVSLLGLALLNAVAVTLASSTEEGPRGVDCLKAVEKCESMEQCRLVLHYYYKSCRQSDTVCVEDRATQCRDAYVALQRYMDKCDCENIDKNHRNHCMQTEHRLFHHPCNEKEGISCIGKEDGVRDNTRHYHVTLPPRPVSCNEAKAGCRNSTYCNVVYVNFRATCPTTRHQCTAAMMDRCRESRDRLRITSLGHCICPKGMPGERKCRRILSRIHRDPCRHQDIFDYPPEPREVLQDMGQTSSCFDAFDRCNANYECRTSLAHYINTCEPDEITGTCDRPACIGSIRDLFKYAPLNLSQPLVECRCEEHDKDCVSLKNGLLPVCARPSTQVPDCLELHRRCKNGQHCRRNPCGNMLATVPCECRGRGRRHQRCSKVLREMLHVVNDCGENFRNSRTVTARLEEGTPTSDLPSSAARHSATCGYRHSSPRATSPTPLKISNTTTLLTMPGVFVLKEDPGIVWMGFLLLPLAASASCLICACCGNACASRCQRIDPFIYRLV
ncbi:uncharacterized protein [Branchiostoma lanceolatum]|uniref:uncharacterized protein n=1 Tax=Branchiostoma lanceolatum TaxID=7740 RepID=UPI0034515FC0